MRNESPASVAPGTRADTLWVWLVVALPVLAALVTIPYLVEMQRVLLGLFETLPVDEARIDPLEMIAWELQFYTRLWLTGPWAIVATIVGWANFGLSVWFAALDSRELARRGFERPFHWAWAFLGSIVYVIGRHVVVRRRGGRGSGPLITAITTQVVSVIASVMWSVFLTLQMLQVAISKVPLP